MSGSRIRPDLRAYPSGARKENFRFFPLFILCASVVNAFFIFQGGAPLRKPVFAILSLALGLACGVLSARTMQAEAGDGGVADRYPDSRYLVRSAGGESPEQAAEAARLEISKFFEARISGESLVREWGRSSSARDGVSPSHRTEVSSSIVVGSSRDIPGIEIVASRGNGGSKRFEVWAVLDRGKYARDLRERVRAADEAVDRMLARPGENDLRRVASLAKCARDLTVRERDRGDLGLLGPTVESRGTLLRQVMGSLDSLVGNALDVGLVFEEGIDDRVRSALLKGIVDAGIRVREFDGVRTASAAGADLVITVGCRIDTRRTSAVVSDREYTFHWLEWMLALKAVDPATGRVVDSAVLSDKVHGGDGEQARERMVSRVLQLQTPKVSSWVYGVIFKPDEK